VPPPDGEAVEPAAEPAPVVREVATVSFDGQKYEVTERRVVLGRSKDCDIQVPDPNVSRRHAEVRQEGATYWLIDLDSTNGVEVKGRRVKRLKLEDGTRFTIGATEIVFSRELA
jgi:pSer/pThr/pTyr-binding forkhead associated (FHA) protein